MMQMEFVKFQNSAGLLGRNVPSPGLAVPHVRRDGYVLRYDVSRTEKNRRVEGALDEFLQLEKGSDDEILNYANRWGPMRLCAAHRLFCAHGAVFSPAFDPSSEWGTFCPPHGWPETEQFEALRYWKVYSAHANSILRVATKLHRGGSPTTEDWRFVVANAPKSLIVEDQPPEELESAVTRAIRSRMKSRDPWEVVARDINNWLLLAGARPRCAARNGGIDLDFTGDPQCPLAGILGIQLMTAVSRVEDLALCAECHIPFIPRRRPAPDENRYCKNCGRKAAMRRASAKWRKENPSYCRPQNTEKNGEETERG